MKRYSVFILALIALGLIVACGNTKSFTEPPSVEVETVDEQPTTRIEMVTGADPNMGKAEADLSEASGEQGATAIEWLDFETAIDKNKEEKKFIFIDIYTGWCTWCKKMDMSTFQDPKVIEYMNKHFYSVKMDAESKEAIAYKEVLYESKAYGNKMYNELAVNLLSGKMSFPSFVILNKREVKRGTINGYQTSLQLINALKKFVE